MHEPMRTQSLFAAGLLALLACSDGGSTDNNPPEAPPENPPTNPPPNPPTNPPVANVEVGDNFYNPQSLNATVGTKVIWTFGGSADHNVTFDGGGPNSATQSSGTFERTFSAAGSFPYHCTVHGAAAMSGSVVVSATGGGTGDGGGGGGPPPNPYE
jgi:plastocyanin